MLHTSLRRRALLAAGGALAGSLTLPGAASATTAKAPETPRAALEAILAGNRRFAAGHPRHPHQNLARVRETAAGQDPFVIVLGCADSRVSPEVLFDQGVGDIFDNRVAGNIVDDLLLGSIEYAVEEFVPPLIVVLGHERCGAVAATLNAVRTGGTAPGHIAAIVAALTPIVTPYVNDPDGVENAVRANVRAQAEALLETSDIVRESVEAGHTAVVGARYDLESGRITLVH
ncbi:carbonic anhydrase [Actinoplanes lutulentus]|uniref:carbonic anhydrase n=1 Tax=Actinoplanes lutulentus TaxID=1287878 RepID=A0A327ZAU1_9ACTN|nr:carbonic anhydrase [Actinoplanes lutulentus]RAK36722.1 carbonic anhydrase [Actinoplanes lutulentus]